MSGLVRSFLRGRSMGDAVTQEREETISILIAHGCVIAPLATRHSNSIKEYLALRDDLHRRGADGHPPRLSLIIKQRILRGLEEDERGH